jgi:hypothetical protein
VRADISPARPLGGTLKLKIFISLKTPKTHGATACNRLWINSIVGQRCVIEVVAFSMVAETFGCSEGWCVPKGGGAW